MRHPFGYGAALALLGAALAQGQGLNVTTAVRAVSQKAANATQYAFEGDLQLVGQRGSEPAVQLAQARVWLAAAPGGRSFLRINSPDKGEYLLVSDGRKSWIWVPKLKQYTEEEASARSSGPEAGDESDTGADEERGLAETYARQVMPILARLYKTASAASVAGQATVKFEKKKWKWPVLRVLAKPDSNGDTSMIELTLDPASLQIGRLAWASVAHTKGEKLLLRVSIDFRSFQIGEAPPNSTFAFAPPKNAKLVDAVPIPGQTGSFFLNRPAPDFELKTLDGQRIRLQDLRGKPVLLSFFASWCPPCRAELPGIVKVYEQFNRQGLVVYGIDDEDRSTVRHFAEKAGLTFPILDDSGDKVYRLYRVWNIPMAFLIDQNGKVVRFLHGGRDYETLRSALKAVGL